MHATTLVERDLIDFVVREARLLDECRYDEWLDLWADDGLYWVPLVPGQPEALQQPPSRAHHLLQTPVVDVADAAHNRFVTRTPFHYTEAQGDESFFLVGTVLHHLTMRDGRLLMALKRVDLLNPDAALPAVQLFI